MMLRLQDFGSTKVDPLPSCMKDSGEKRKEETGLYEENPPLFLPLLFALLLAFNLLDFDGLLEVWITSVFIC